ncbi:IclR family transcriptional regulator [Poseidonocella sp. HB161398]|uniref:IclR family transcriptional regulator n=1 Tax=Poseidonocella sp. HB161398 TaxID=2320855 RepID=UPI001108F126|nr:IclR family transcriptional regulator [Poseidonocella sp. HB161398]
MKLVADDRYPHDIASGGAGIDATQRESAVRTIQSVERALTLLELVAQHPEGISLSDLAAASGLKTSTCHHLAATLVARGYVEQYGRNRTYVMGHRIRDLNEMAEAKRDPAVILRDPLRELGRRLAHAVQMAVLSESKLLTKLSIPDPNGRTVEPDEVEKMGAAHATATGKAILAWIPDTELVRVISANGLAAYTPRTITSLSGLVEELRLTRRRKYALDDEEFREGTVCIGASLRNGAGAVIGAISVSYATAEDSDAYRRHLVTQMIAAGNDFSRLLEAAQRPRA